MAWLASLAVLVALAIGVAWVGERRESRRLARRVREAEERAERARRAQDDFFDLVTHELRSPLSAVLGYQELMADEAYGILPAEAAEPLRRIGRSARHLLHLIDGVVELSRLRAGAVTPITASIQLGPVLAGVADAFRTHTRDRGITGRVRLPERPPALRTDPDRLIRALDLLVTSAVKHPAGESLDLVVETGPEGLEVRIQGTALRPADSPDQSLRLGLRLAITSRIALLLGGSLQCDPHDDGLIRTLRLRIPPQPAPPAHDL